MGGKAQHKSKGKRQRENHHIVLTWLTSNPVGEECMGRINTLFSGVHGH
jgi:hypothetical protein